MNQKPGGGKPSWQTPFPTPKTRISTQNQQILMNGLEKNVKNLNFWEFWAKMAKFCTVFGQNWQNGEFFQKSAWKIFLALTSPNELQSFRKKVMNGFRETASRTDERTDGRTDVNPQVSNDFVERPKTVRCNKKGYIYNLFNCIFKVKQK